MNKESQFYIRYTNYDNDIPLNLECAKIADNFSHKIIPIIIKDDSEAFLEIVSSPEFDHDGSLLQARERFYLSDYLYQPFFDELTGPTVLSFAAFFKAEKIVETILNLPIVDKTDSLHFACAGGSLNIVRMLFDQNECDRLNKDHVRPITIASYFGNVDVVKYLYSHGCQIINPKENNSCINKAAFNGNINVLDFFREIDPNLVKKMKNYLHPIISAAKGGQPECVKYLIKYGKPNIDDIFAALIESCKSGSLSCVKILFEYFLNQNSIENKDKKIQTKRRRKKKKDDDDEEFNPVGKKAKTKKKQQNDEEAEEEDHEEETFNCLYNAAISNFHLDILRYLLMRRPTNSMDSLLSTAIFQIKYDELLLRILPKTYVRGPYQNIKDKILFANLWLKKSALALKTAKYILMNCHKTPFTDSFFEKLTNENNIDSVIYFLNEIDFTIKQDSNLSRNQIYFFRLAFLMANVKTIPMLKKIMNNNKFDLFNDGFFEPLKDTRNIDYGDPNYYLNLDRNDNDNDGNESVSYITKELIMNSFIPYAKTISKREFDFSDECALFLIENSFPFYLLADLDDLPVNTFTLNLPFFKACLKLGYFDYAKKFLLLMPLNFCFDALLEIFCEASKKFNKDYDPKKDLTEKMQYFKENRLDGALRAIINFNRNHKFRIRQNKFNIFNYECKNEEEIEIYQQYMSLIKMIIRMASNFDEVAFLLCTFGLTKKWIIEQTKNETDDLINPISDKSKITPKIMKNKRKKIKKAPDNFSIFSVFNQKKIPDDWYMNSLNPLINATLRSDINDIIRSSSTDSFKNIEILKYYLNYGIDVSNGTEYAELLWKKVIYSNKGYVARFLIQYGKADKDLLISNSDSQKVSLFDFALEKKAISILFTFFENEFYPQDSLINTDPNSVVINLNNEPTDQSFDLRENNLKIILLIYKYKKGNYDLKLKKKLMIELSELMVPLRNINKPQFNFY